jgi:hypothetical protein
MADDLSKDDLSKKGSQDRSRVNMHEDYKVRCWSKKLGCIGRPAQGRHSKGGEFGASC